MFIVFAKINASTARIVAADIIEFDDARGSLAAFADWAAQHGYTEFSGTSGRPAWFSRATGAVVAYVSVCFEHIDAEGRAYNIREAARAAAIAYSFSSEG